MPICFDDVTDKLIDESLEVTEKVFDPSLVDESVHEEENNTKKKTIRDFILSSLDEDEVSWEEKIYRSILDMRKRKKQEEF